MAKGYTKIENDIFDFILSSDIRDAELKILLFLIRYTKGFQRDTVRAGYSYISKGTGYGEWTVRKCIKKLEDKQLIEIPHRASGSAPQLVKINYCNFTIRGSGTTIHQLVTEQHDKVVQEHHQDIKEDIKYIDIKEKEKASPQNLTSFLPCETSLMREMSEEDRARYLALLPKELLERDPDDYTDEEWDIYDDWRVSNGLI